MYSTEKKKITKDMITTFRLLELGYDFMGYTFDEDDLSFHHLLMPSHACKDYPDKGRFMCNGAILNIRTSHKYLHLIERVDPFLFYLITSELIDINILRRVEIDNLWHIRKLLLEFEKEHKGEMCHKKLLIDPKYVKDRIPL